MHDGNEIKGIFVSREWLIFALTREICKFTDFCLVKRDF
jgi:hypothetical protein